MSETIPTVEPIDIPEYKYKNSKYGMMPNLPARIYAWHLLREARRCLSKT